MMPINKLNRANKFIAMTSFNYIAKKLGGQNYKVIIKNPNQFEQQTITIFGILQLMQKRTLTNFGETEDYEGEFYTATKLPDAPATTLLLRANNKQYHLLLKYDLSNQAGSPAIRQLSHVCYRLKEFGCVTS